MLRFYHNYKYSFVEYLTRITYYRLLFLYLCLCAVFGGLFIFVIELNHEWYSPFDNITQPLYSKSYTDCFFTAVSALTCTGLITLDTQRLQVGSQVIVWILMLLGGTQIGSLFPVIIRRFYFKREIRRASKFLKDPLGAKENSEVRLELNSLTFLCFIIPAYWIFWQCFLVVFIGVAFAAGNTTQIEIRNVSKVWSAVFLSTSSYANAGFTLFDDNLVSVGSFNPGLLIVLLIGVLLGNTAYPPVLRGIVYLISLLPTPLKPVTQYLLDHPRKCYTHMFPRFPNLFLIMVLVVSNLFQFLAAVGLNWNLAFVQPYDNWQRLINLLFSTVVTRTAGFASLDITQFSAGSQILFLVFMYIAAYPIAVAIRITSLNRKVVRLDKSSDSADDGVELHQAAENQVNKSLEKEDTNPFANVIALVVTDVFLLCFGLFLICSVESYEWRSVMHPTDFFGSIYRTIFDTISAYGTVGLSLGYPGTVLSWVASLTIFSKLCMCMFMIMGRLRALPSDIDPTVRIGLVMTSQEIDDLSRALAMHGAEPGSSETESIATGEVIPELLVMQPTVRKSLEVSRLREVELRGGSMRGLDSSRVMSDGHAPVSPRVDGTHVAEPGREARPSSARPSVNDNATKVEKSGDGTQSQSERRVSVTGEVREL